MPNYLDLFGQNYSVNNNPLSKLAVNPTAFVGALPELLKLLDDLQSVLNRLIPELNALFGINLPDAQQLVAFIQNLLRAFNLTGAQSFLEQLISALGGSGSLLSDFHNAVSALAGIGQTLLDLLMNVFGITGTGHLIGDLQALLDNIFGSTFPKVFPFTFGTSTSGTPAPFVALAKFQQLLDGLKNDGSIGNDVAAVVGAFQAALDAARSDISQAILDGINGSNSNTGVAQGLQAFPNINITSILNQGSLGGDVGALATLLFGSHTVGTHILASIITNVLGGTDIGADLTALATLLFGSPTVGTHILASIITNVLGGTDLGADIGALATLLFGSHTVGAHVLSSAIANILGGTDLGADVQSIVSRLTTVFGGSTTTLTALMTLLGNTFGSTFPKVFPFTFGSSTSNTPAPFVTQAQFQQLVDGLVNNGTTGNTPATAIGAFQAALDAARSDVSQAILDGINGLNNNTGVAQGLQAFPNINITSILNQGSLGGDVAAIVAQGVTALGGASATLPGWIAALQAIPNNNILSQFGMVGLGADVQAIVDVGVNALTGGSGTGNAPSALGANLAAIQQSTNIVIPPNSGSGSVTHDASGNGTNTGSSNALTNSWSHTTGAGANLAIVQTATYCADTFSSGGSLVRGVKWGTAAMSNLGGYIDNNFIYHEVWILWNPSIGTVTVTASAIETGFSIESVAAMAGGSDTYIGVGGIGSVSKATGANGTSPSITQAGAVGDYVVNSFAAYPVTSMGTYNQTSLFTVASLGSPVLGFTVGDAIGAASVTFTDTSPSWGSGGLWTGLSFNLTPLLSGEIGSGFMSNRTSTGTVASTVAVAAISSAFYTQTAITADLTWTASTNTITVTYAGWYMVSIGILLSGHSSLFGVALFHNGSVAQLGTVYPSAVVGTSGMSGPFTASFTIYLSAGDTVQPGYDSGAIGNTMTGEATGAASYFNVALLNRSVY